QCCQTPERQVFPRPDAAPTFRRRRSNRLTGNGLRHLGNIAGTPPESRFHPDYSANKNHDAEFTAFYNSVQGAQERRKYVWERYVFPDTPYDNRHWDDGVFLQGGQVALQNQIYRHLEEALKDFNRQWAAYVNEVRIEATAYTLATDHDFMGEEFMKQHPFNPVLRYKGVPQKLQDQQEANRVKLRNMVKQAG